MNNSRDSLEDTLDLCVIAMSNGERSLDECLLAYPQHQEALEPLLKLTGRLRGAQGLKPPAGFRAAALSRFQEKSVHPDKPAKSPYPTRRPSEAPRSAHNHAAPPPSAGPRRVLPDRSRMGRPVYLALMILALMVLFTSTLTFAANNAIPGGSLYPVKRAIEDARLSLSRSVVGDQQLHLRFATRRMVEVDRLLRLNRDLYIDIALENYSQHVAYINNTLKSPGLPEKARSVIAGRILNNLYLGEAQLQTLYERISPEQRAAIRQAMQDAKQARLLASQVVESLPDARTTIRETLISTLALSGTRPAAQITLQASFPGATGTPIVNPTDFIFPTPDPSLVSVSPELPGWFIKTPDARRLATLYPTIYATLADMATRISQITATPRPALKPTTTRQENPSLPRRTPMPAPPILPTR